MQAYNGFMVWLVMALTTVTAVILTVDGVCMASIATGTAIVFPLYGLLVSKLYT